MNMLHTSNNTNTICVIRTKILSQHTLAIPTYDILYRHYLCLCFLCSRPSRREKASTSTRQHGEYQLRKHSWSMGISDSYPNLKSEMQKVGDTGDISLLFFLAGANFWAILGHFWAILAILHLCGHHYIHDYHDHPPLSWQCLPCESSD